LPAAWRREKKWARFWHALKLNGWIRTFRCRAKRLSKAPRGRGNRSGRVFLRRDAGADGLDHRFAHDGLAMHLAHVLDGAAHYLRLFLMARMPVAARNERSAMEFLHRPSPFSFFLMWKL